MVKACSAPGCRYQYRKGDGIKMHSFPNNTNIKFQWLQVMAKDQCPNYPSKNSVVCSQHFEAHCYITRVNEKLSLKKDALPTIFYDSKSIRPVIHTHLSSECEGKDEVDFVHVDSVEARLQEIFGNVGNVGVGNAINQHGSNEPVAVESIMFEVLQDTDKMETQSVNESDSLSPSSENIDHEESGNDKSILAEDEDDNIEYAEEEDEDENIEYVEEEEDSSGNAIEIYYEDTVAEQPTRNRKQPRFLGDFIYEDLEDPVQRKKFWLMSHKMYMVQRKKLKYCSGRMRVLEKRVQSLTTEIQELNDRNGNESSGKASKRLIYVAQKHKNI